MTERKAKDAGREPSASEGSDASARQYKPDIMSKPTLRMEAIKIPLEAYRDDMLLPVEEDEDGEEDDGPVLRAKVERITDPPPTTPANGAVGANAASGEEPPVTTRAAGTKPTESAPDLDPLELDPLDWSDD